MVRSACGVLVVCAAACGTGGGSGETGFPRPTGYVAVSIAVDDRANKVFDPAQLQWKGAMRFDPTTRIAVRDDTWTGPFAPLYDDGPWDQGGHEGRGATADDHILGATVFLQPPATLPDVIGASSIEYGLVDVRYEADYTNGWLWPLPENGSISLAVKQTADLQLPAVVLPEFGKIDLRLTLDLSRLEVRKPAWKTSTVAVKGSHWCWGPVTATDDGTKGDAVAGDGIFTFVLSQWVGFGRPFNHTGLLGAGMKPEFVWVLGGEEYIVGGRALAGGATAEIRPPGGAWTPAAVLVQPVSGGNQNTYVEVP